MSELSEVGSDLESRPSNPKACVSCTKYLQMTISMDSQHDPASAFDPSVIVIDNGTGSVKGGYAGSNYPSVVVPNVVGRPVLRSNVSQASSNTAKSVYIGEDAFLHSDMLSISHPMERGIIRSWDDMCTIWEHVFGKLASETGHSDRKILMTESSSNSTKSREKMLELVFEKFNFSGAYISLQNVLALYAQGWSTGIVVDSGEGVTDIVPVFDGYALPHASRRVDVSGRDITKYLIKLLGHRGYALNRSSDLDAMRLAKEKLCYVGANIGDEKHLAKETTVLEEKFTLPDGRTICLGSERFEAPEAMFTTHLIDVETPGLSEQLFSSIQAVDVDLRSSLYQNILLTGGSTLFPGLTTRLDAEMKKLYLDRILKGDTSRMDRLKLKIEDPPNRQYNVFQGGALLANIMRHNDPFWILKQEWEEKGAKVLSKLGPR